MLDMLESLLFMLLEPTGRAILLFPATYFFFLKILRKIDLVCKMFQPRDVSTKLILFVLLGILKVP